MKALSVILSILSLAACGGSTEPQPGKRADDPYVTIRVRNQLDTTTAPGRAHWHMFMLLSGPYPEQNGIARQGAISLQDVRTNHDIVCMYAASDSIGQRLISPIALADTTTSNGTPDATAKAIVEAWYAGNHTLPAGWMALFVPPTDAWVSDQFDAGRGRVPSDPIKWGFDWTERGAMSFYERTDADPICSTYL